jgi:hypothetical protein
MREIFERTFCAWKLVLLVGILALPDLAMTADPITLQGSWFGRGRRATHCGPAGGGGFVIAAGGEFPAAKLCC